MTLSPQSEDRRHRGRRRRRCIGTRARRARARGARVRPPLRSRLGYQRKHRRADRPWTLLRLGIPGRTADAAATRCLAPTPPIKVKPRADVDLIRWGLRFLRECTPSRSRANTLAKLALARYSQQLTDELAHREGLQFCHTDSGVLYLYRDESELQAAERNSMLLRDHGLEPGDSRFRAANRRRACATPQHGTIRRRHP